MTTDWSKHISANIAKVTLQSQYQPIKNISKTAWSDMNRYDHISTNIVEVNKVPLLRQINRWRSKKQIIICPWL